MAESTAIITTEANRQDRSALAAVRALARAGRRVVVASSGAHSLAESSRWTSETVRVPLATDGGFQEAIHRLTEKQGAAVVFPTSDAALVALNPRTRPFVDKTSLESLASSANLRMPESRAFHTAAELDQHAGDIGYPVVVKAGLKGPSDPPTTLVRSRDQLPIRTIERGVVQPFLTGTTRALAGVVWDGRIIAVLQQRYVRTFPSSAGTASMAVTEMVDRSLVKRLEGLLSDMSSIFQAQFIDGLLIDLNLRPYGSMPLALAAGVNLPDIFCRLVSGERVEGSEARQGVRYRWIDGDVRSLLSEVRAGERTIRSALSAVLPRTGTVHSIASIADPKPMWVRLSGRPGARS